MEIQESHKKTIGKLQRYTNSPSHETNELVKVVSLQGEVYIPPPKQKHSCGRHRGFKRIGIHLSEGRNPTDDLKIPPG